MLHEKPDEMYPWKNKLDGLDKLPGEEMLDRSRLWEKLHGRLQEKPSRKMGYWYWIAAASLLLAILLPVTLQQRRQDATAKIKHKQIHQVPGREHPVITRSAIQPAPIAANPKQQQGRTVKNRFHHSVVQKTAPVVDPDQNLTLLPVPAAESVNLSVFTDTSHVVATAPEQKRLRVVHINELDMPFKAEADRSAKSATAAYQSKPLHQRASRGFEFGTNVSDDLIKIKLSPSN